jgi:hypothetical protein
MGRRMQWNTTPQKTNNNSIEVLVENEGKEYPVVDRSRKIISMSNKLNEDLKMCSKRISKRRSKRKLKRSLKRTAKITQRI